MLCFVYLYRCLQKHLTTDFTFTLSLPYNYKSFVPDRQNNCSDLFMILKNVQPLQVLRQTVRAGVFSVFCPWVILEESMDVECYRKVWRIRSHFHDLISKRSGRFSGQTHSQQQQILHICSCLKTAREWNSYGTVNSWPGPNNLTKF